MIDLSGLEELVEIQSVSGDESAMKSYILDFVAHHKKQWTVTPKVIEGNGFQDALILVFGEPRTAIFAHMDSIGYMVGYNNELISIGGPRLIDGTQLVGIEASEGIETELMIIENEDESMRIKAVSDRILERGTNLTFKPNFRETENHVQSPYMDDRLGVWVALEVCKTLENGVIVFSTYEEQGGGSVGFLGKHLIDQLGVYQALICDITWITDGILEGKGVAISLHDQGIPRKSYVNRIIKIAKEAKIPYQLEVESSGGSDGAMLQQTDLAFDWCLVGAAEDYVHSPDEKVHKADIKAMVELYQVLMKKL